MAIFYTHLMKDGEWFQDVDGRDMVDLAAARTVALREMLAVIACTSLNDERRCDIRVVIDDAHGHRVATLTWGDVIGMR